MHKAEPVVAIMWKLKFGFRLSVCVCVFFFQQERPSTGIDMKNRAVKDSDECSLSTIININNDISIKSSMILYILFLGSRN